MNRIRCAIYTRKSSEDGLEQEFNSLHAQREACAAYILSQKAEGWIMLPDAYDDGGLSGGTLERPALQRLMADIDAGRVDQIVVYKIDRLTRSLADFAKIVDRLDAASTSFVSVTQSFNTATSMGRLTLNMLLSFAQFEREVTAERIRDKIAASKRKGLWMGGLVPLGYIADGRTLKIEPREAETIRTLYRLYLELGTIRAVKGEAERLGLRSRRRITGDGRASGGKAFDRGHLHHILTNPLYAGRIRHKATIHEGQHPAIIPAGQWEAVQAALQAEAARPRAKRSAQSPSPLAGKIFDETGDRLTPSHSRTRRGERLRYYISRRLITRSGEAGITGWRLPAPAFEVSAARLVQDHLASSDVRADLLAGASADEVQRITRVLQQEPADGSNSTFPMIDRITIRPGKIEVALARPALEAYLHTEVPETAERVLRISAPFQHRKRGVETRLVIGAPAQQIDTALLTNVARAHDWFERIKAGATYDQIAVESGTSKRRVQQMLDLAFLAPDIVRAITEGRQPVGLTSDWIIRHDLPSDWDAQRALIASL